MKVAIYCRLSEEDRNKRMETDDSGSIQNQKALLIQYAMEHSWDVYDIYSDDDYAGADRKRPEFNRLITDAKAKRFQIVLCKTQSRFTREMELVEKYIHGLFPELGIRFVSIVDNADTANKGNKKARQINGLVNEWYLEDMSDSIKSVLINRRENGHHIGSFALYGYMKDPDVKGHLIIDEEAADVVREVFTLFSQGIGKSAIARLLNDKGIPNPTEYKRLKGLRYQPPKTKNSTLWKYFAISDMLTNEMYIGNMVQGKYGSISYKTKENKPRPKENWYRVANTHEPIIDRKLWDRVQKMIADRMKPFSTGEIGIFAKKVRCANCGYVMRSCKSRGTHYLQCANKHIAKDACKGAFISVDRLEGMVIEELKRLSLEYLDKDELEQSIEFAGNLQARRAKILSDNNAYKKKIAEYTKGICDIYMDKVKGVITERNFLDLSKDFAAGKERLEKMIEQNEREISDLDEKIKAGDNRRELIESYTNLEHLSREVVDALIEYIVVDRRILGTKDVPIEIHWNF